jgi:DNA-binding MarR family transcriptional regulator
MALPKLIKEGLVEKRSEPSKRYPVYVKLTLQQQGAEENEKM